MLSWIISWWYRQLLKSQSDCPYKVKNETDSLKSDCVLEIIYKTEASWLFLKAVPYKAGIKELQYNSSRIYRDEFGSETQLGKPLYSENQIARIRRTYKLYYFVGALFVIGESFLYSLTAALFAPNVNSVIQGIVALFITLVLMFSLNGALEEYVKHTKAVEAQRNGKQLPQPLKLYKDFRLLGYILFLVTSGAILLGALSRVFFLENINVSGLDSERAKAVTIAVKLGAIFSLLLTIATTLYLAMLKRKLSLYSDHYKVYIAWKRAYTRRNAMAQQAIKNATRLLLTIETVVEKYWQLVIDVKRVYQLPNETDERYVALHQEYVLLKSTSAFILTESTYRKFAPIQAAHEELFEYGILAKSKIQERIQFCSHIIEAQQMHIQKELNSKPDESVINNPATFVKNHTNRNFETSKSKKQ